MKYTYHETENQGGIMPYFTDETGAICSPPSEEFGKLHEAATAQQVRDYCHTDYEIRKRTITTSLEPGKTYEI